MCYSWVHSQDFGLPAFDQALDRESEGSHCSDLCDLIIETPSSSISRVFKSLVNRNHNLVAFGLPLWTRNGTYDDDDDDDETDVTILFQSAGKSRRSQEALPTIESCALEERLEGSKDDPVTLKTEQTDRQYDHEKAEGLGARCV